MLRGDGKLTSMKIPVHTGPKTCQKLFLSLIFSIKTCHFLLFFTIFCVKIAATNFRVQLRGVCWCQWFFTCMEGWHALVSPAQVSPIQRDSFQKSARWWKIDEIKWKINFTFLPFKCPKRAQSWWKIDKHENSSSYVPKNLSEIVIKPNFFC